MVTELSSLCDLHQGKSIIRSSSISSDQHPVQGEGRSVGGWAAGARAGGSGFQSRGAADLHVGSVEIPERGEGGRQPLGAVPDPQGLEMA